ncbi:MAG: hypothetical protein IH936_00600 [Acidobacteria bacterium]|nr:hypothetical protein [Acidobacteriota bacterium]
MRKFVLLILVLMLASPAAAKWVQQRYGPVYMAITSDSAETVGLSFGMARGQEPMVYISALRAGDRRYVPGGKKIYWEVDGSAHGKTAILTEDGLTCFITEAQLQEVMNGNRMRVSYTSVTGDRVNASFSLAGSRAAIQQARRSAGQ